MTTVIEGWGVQMYRLTVWKRQASLKARSGITLSRQATLAGWRHQMGSTARTWAAVEQEATELIAVWTMCRLIEAAYMYDIVDQEPAKQQGWCSRCKTITTEHHDCIYI